MSNSGTMITPRSCAYCTRPRMSSWVYTRGFHLALGLQVVAAAKLEQGEWRVQEWEDFFQRTTHFVARTTFPARRARDYTLFGWVQHPLLHIVLVFPIPIIARCGF